MYILPILLKAYLMNNAHNQYTYNIKWSIIEAIFFQSFLFMHQYILFKINDQATYGLIGSLFGILYLLVKAFDLGINKALVSFYNDYLKDRSSAYHFLYYQLQPSLVFYCVAFATVLIVKIYFAHMIPLLNYLDYVLIGLLFGLIATESIKSITKRILQLSNHFRQVALWEISFIICYQAAIWTYYYLGHSVSIHFIFGSFLILSTIETIGLLLWSFRWFKSLPQKNKTFYNRNEIIKNRFFAYSHTMGKQIFSANILVPLFAYLFGLEQAALLKLASYMTHSITSIIERIIDPASSTFFAQTRNNTNKEKQESFSFSSQLLHHLLISIFIFIIINGSKLLSLSNTNSTILFYIIFYFCIHYIETFFITIEKFYIAHGRPEFLLINTACNAFLAAILFLFSPSPLLALTFLLLLRLLYFFTVKIYMAHLWDIHHQISFKFIYIVGSLGISLFYFIIA